ncbi:MAG TPA: hypothetical protein VGO61_18765 [Steroidobacteraceae bacterium]|jgi:hypothetical protein|nr:hypothetical protein [Steroidobacteraceae bacterium]
MRFTKTLIGPLALAFQVVTAHAAPQQATFSRDVSSAQWPLAELDPQLPTDWSDAEFLVIEFRSSTSQRFELGLISDEGTVSKRIHPFPNVWVRASIPLRFYRQDLGDAGDLAATVNQPRNSYWINIEAGGHAPVKHVRALSVTMRYPAHASTLGIRKLSISRTDPGDAVLDGGTPLIDDFGQYLHDDWPGKVRSLEALKTEWAQENRMLVPKAALRACRYGGFATNRRKATGFFRVEKVNDRWWLVDPEGCRFFSAGVNGAGAEPPRTQIVGRAKLFASIPTAAQFPAPDADPDPLRDPVSFYAANLRQRFGEDWRASSAQLTSRRMRAWGLNTAYGATLNEALPTGSSLRQPYVYPLRGWQQSEGAIMGLPDVYSDAFARRVDAEAFQQLADRKNDPWMIGYFIGNEPPWPARESQLVELVLARPASAIQQRFKAALSKGDTPAIRKALVHAAFRRYLEIVNAAVKRHDPNHLNLGIRFGGTPPDDVIALARGFDVYSMNKYRWAPPKDFIDRVYAIQKLPILIGEFHFGVPERGLAPGLVQAMNQAERGVAYSFYVEHAAEHPAIVGTHWYQWVDQPSTGRRDGENYNIGWIDVTDRPYPELVAAAKATHAKLDEIHSGKLAATTRKPRASEFGTPEDSIQLGIPAIQ